MCVWQVHCLQRPQEALVPWSMSSGTCELPYVGTKLSSKDQHNCRAISPTSATILLLKILLTKEKSKSHQEGVEPYLTQQLSQITNSLS